MPAVLVLNQDWQALAVAREPRALALIQRGKAEPLAFGVAPIQTPSCSIPRPAVIRLVNFVKRPRPRVRFTRHNVFLRDNHECAYCGKSMRSLTIDHVMPLSRGGRDEWTNVVASCFSCNHRKGPRTPQEAHMPLRHAPFEPKVGGWLHLIGVTPAPEWLPFLGEASR